MTNDELAADRVPARMFEGLFIIGLQADEPLRQALREAGVDLERLELDYPVEAMVRAVEVARRVRFPHLEQAAGEREIGRALGRGFMGTEVGQVLGAGMALMAPDRILVRLPRLFSCGRRTVNVTSEHQEDRSWILRFERSHAAPQLMAGCVEALVEISQVRADVRMVRSGPEGYELAVRWEEPTG